MSLAWVKPTLFVAALLAAFAGGWSWRGSLADVEIAELERAHEKEAARLQALVDAASAGAQDGADAAGDAGDDEREKIHEDYAKRLEDALAGRDGELGRLRKQWAGCETSRLAEGSAAAAAAAEEDRLRRASAARVVRAVELCQSERNEVIDRYLAVYEAFEQ